MQNLEKLIEVFLGELTHADGAVAFDSITAAADVSAKQLEFRMLLSTLNPEAQYLIDKFDQDPVLSAEDPQARLQGLVVYARTTLKLLQRNIIRDRGTLIPTPDFSILTESMPGLALVITARWKEAQRCQNAGAYLSTIIMQGSILEALLLSRMLQDTTAAQRSRRAPKTPDGKVPAIQDWQLNELLAVAIDLGWLKSDLSDFSFAIRKYRYLIHPWGEVSAKFPLNAGVCNACWKVLDRAVDDLLKSV